MEKKLDLFDLYEVFYVDVHLVDTEIVPNCHKYALLLVLVDITKTKFLTLITITVKALSSKIINAHLVALNQRWF